MRVDTRTEMRVSHRWQSSPSRRGSIVLWQVYGPCPLRIPKTQSGIVFFLFFPFHCVLILPAEALFATRRIAYKYNMRVDMRTDMRVGMRTGMRAGTRTDMRIDMLVDMHTDMHTDMRIYTCI